MRRKIVKIDEGKCTGCGLCIPNCAEGALRIIDGKARLISDKFCDGLGACLGHCPEDAITIIEREAEEFDEKAVEHHLQNERKAETKMSYPGCPSSRPIEFSTSKIDDNRNITQKSSSTLSNWPVQLKLVPIQAPYFQDKDLLICADCVAFAYPDFHKDFLNGRKLVIGCPKLDDNQFYKEKLTEILKQNPIKNIMVTYMEVPCCFGIVMAVENAISASAKEINLKKIKIGVNGEIKLEEEKWLKTQP